MVFSEGFNAKRFGKGSKHTEETKRLLKMGKEGRRLLLERRRKKTSKRIAKRNLELLYGISQQEYDNMLNKQDNRCGICGCYAGDNRRLAIDHNHTTGKVRGLLCTNCNIGIGLLKESKQIFENAMEYLGLK